MNKFEKLLEQTQPPKHYGVTCSPSTWERLKKASAQTKLKQYQITDQALIHWLDQLDKYLAEKEKVVTTK